ncbi:MAG: hypothetical protein ABI120_20505, partial [Gemmatimonadaceae bacterium]
AQRGFGALANGLYGFGGSSGYFALERGHGKGTGAFARRSFAHFSMFKRVYLKNPNGGVKYPFNPQNP